MEYYECDKQGNILPEGYFYYATGNALSYKEKGGRLTNTTDNYQVKSINSKECVMLIDGNTHYFIC